MKIIVNNETYIVQLHYVNDDVTVAELQLPQTTAGRDLPPTVLANVETRRYVGDPPASKAKRRVFAITKLLRGRRNWSRAMRRDVWSQLWMQMKVPASMA